MREGGVEPPRPKAPDPKSGVAAVTPLPRGRQSRSLRPAGCREQRERAGRRRVWQADAVPRDPREIQLEIDAARESLAATLDDLAFRTSPQRLKAQGKARAQAFLQSPPGIAVVSGVGLLVTFVATRRVVRGVRARRDRNRVVTVPVPVGVRTRRR